MEKVLHMEIMEDEKTGKRILKFIEWTSVTYGNHGYWTERNVSDEQFKQLMKICYPKWDGEHQIDSCCTYDYDGDAGEATCKTLNCPSCPYEDCPMHSYRDPWFEAMTQFLLERNKKE